MLVAGSTDSKGGYPKKEIIAYANMSFMGMKQMYGLISGTVPREG